MHFWHWFFKFKHYCYRNWIKTTTTTTTTATAATTTIVVTTIPTKIKYNNSSFFFPPQFHRAFHFTKFYLYQRMHLFLSYTKIT